MMQFIVLLIFFQTIKHPSCIYLDLTIIWITYLFYTKKIIWLLMPGCRILFLVKIDTNSQN